MPFCILKAGIAVGQPILNRNDEPDLTRNKPQPGNLLLSQTAQIARRALWWGRRDSNSRGLPSRATGSRILSTSPCEIREMGVDAELCETSLRKKRNKKLNDFFFLFYGAFRRRLVPREGLLRRGGAYDEWERASPHSGTGERGSCRHPVLPTVSCGPAP